MIDVTTDVLFKPIITSYQFDLKIFMTAIYTFSKTLRAVWLIVLHGVSNSSCASAWRTLGIPVGLRIECLSRLCFDFPIFVSRKISQPNKLSENIRLKPCPGHENFCLSNQTDDTN